LSNEARSSFDILYKFTSVLQGLFRRLAWRGKPETKLSNDLELTGMEQEMTCRMTEGFEERAWWGKHEAKISEDLRDNQNGGGTPGIKSENCEGDWQGWENKRPKYLRALEKIGTVEETRGKIN
jgi:hypothetical protein